MFALAPVGLLLTLSNVLSAQEYKIKVIASGLARPTGIAVDDDDVYFTEVPSPGVGGSTNAVKVLDLEKKIRTLHMGEPEPLNIAIGSDGTIYWVCLRSLIRLGPLRSSDLAHLDC